MVVKDGEDWQGLLFKPLNHDHCSFNKNSKIWICLRKFTNDMRGLVERWKGMINGYCYTMWHPCFINENISHDMASILGAKTERNHVMCLKTIISVNNYHWQWWYMKLLIFHLSRKFVQ